MIYSTISVSNLISSYISNFCSDHILLHKIRYFSPSFFIFYSGMFIPTMREIETLGRPYFLYCLFVHIYVCVFVCGNPALACTYSIPLLCGTTALIGSPAKYTFFSLGAKEFSVLHAPVTILFIKIAQL